VWPLELVDLLIGIPASLFAVAAVVVSAIRWWRQRLRSATVDVAVAGAAPPAALPATGSTLQRPITHPPRPSLKPDFVEQQYGDLIVPVYRETRDMLSRIGRPTSWFVVDDCIRLYRGQGRDGLSGPVAVRAQPDPLLTEVSELTDSTIESIITEAQLDSPVARYLRARPRTADVHPYWPKVSLRRVFFGNDHTDDGVLVLDVCPMSFWVEKEINRRFVLNRGTDKALVSLFDDYTHRVLGSGRQQDGYETLMPNTLYVEVAVLTADGKLLVMSKPEDTGSAFAKVNRGRTCGVERSLDWARSFSTPGWLDPSPTVMAALRSELGITDVTDIRWNSIVVQGHFNTALLGVVRLAQMGRDLKRHRYPRMERVKLVDLEQVADEVFSPEVDGEWHTTARMRALTMLDQELGEEDTAQLIRRARRGASANTILAVGRDC
jgi:hypothetical protein